MVATLADLKLDHSDFMTICSGDLICDKNKKFQGYPKRDVGPNRKDLQDAASRTKI